MKYGWYWEWTEETLGKEILMWKHIFFSDGVGNRWHFLMEQMIINLRNSDGFHFGAGTSRKMSRSRCFLQRILGILQQTSFDSKIPWIFAMKSGDLKTWPRIKTIGSNEMSPWTIGQHFLEWISLLVMGRSVTNLWLQACLILDMGQGVWSQFADLWKHAKFSWVFHLRLSQILDSHSIRWFQASDFWHLEIAITLDSSPTWAVRLLPYLWGIKRW